MLSREGEMRPNNGRRDPDRAQESREGVVEVCANTRDELVVFRKSLSRAGDELERRRDY